MYIYIYIGIFFWRGLELTIVNLGIDSIWILFFLNPDIFMCFLISKSKLCFWKTVVCIFHLWMKVNTKAEEIERRRQAEEELLGPQRFLSLLVVFLNIWIHVWILLA